MGGLSPSFPPADPQLSTLQPEQDSTHCPTRSEPWTRGGGFAWAVQRVWMEQGGCVQGQPSSWGLQGHPALAAPHGSAGFAGRCVVSELGASCHRNTACGWVGVLVAPCSWCSPGGDVLWALWHVGKGTRDAPG